MTPTSAELATSPDHYLHAFEGDAAVFVAMDRAAYARSIFLDARISPAADGALRVPLASLEPPPPGELQWIFHVAHCGSTLLARALDALPGGLVLREPLALRQAALTGDAARLALVLGQLGKRYPGAGPTLVKANVPVNFALPAIAAADPQAAAIMLHCGLDDYLLAILRSDNHRGWVRGVTTLLAHHLGDLAGASDAQRAAALWCAQMRRFAAALAVMPRARSLDAELFFARPANTLAAAARHLGRDADPGAVERLVGGPLFATYSKNPGVAFDNAARLARKAALAAPLAGEIAQAGRWLAESGADAALVAIAGAALVS